MKPPKFASTKTSFILAALLAAPSLMFADFSYQQSTQITGGSLVSVVKTAGIFSSQARHITDPITSTVYVKGNRLANISTQRIEIIDLDKQTITTADPEKRTYSTMTFEQIRQKVAEAARKAEEERAKHPEQNQAQSPAAGSSDVNTSFDVKVRKTGETKSVNGLNAEHAILTMMLNATNTKTSESGAMGITNDIWLAPAPAGYAEIRAFYVRMAQEMGSSFTGSEGLSMSKMLATQPGASQAMANLATEMQKLQGMPVLEIMRMGMTTNGQPLPAASEIPLAASDSSSGSDTPGVGSVVKDTAVAAARDEAIRRTGRAGAISSLAGGFGGFGGFGHKKKQAPPPEEKPATQAQQASSAVLLESKSESSNFSSAPIDDSHFEVPTGYREVTAK